MKFKLFDFIIIIAMIIGLLVSYFMFLSQQKNTLLLESDALDLCTRAKGLFYDYDKEKPICIVNNHVYYYKIKNGEVFLVNP